MKTKLLKILFSKTLEDAVYFISGIGIIGITVFSLMLLL
jgi:hypothetical protein